MKQVKNIYALLALVLLFMLSCSDDDSTTISNGSLGYQYIPLKVGGELIYQVDSISYDEFRGTVDTTIYYIRELVEEEFVDLEGNTSYLVGIYQRSSDTVSWTKQRNISKKVVNRKYERLENNTLLIPLVFPLNESVTWDVNALNPKPEELYSYESTHESKKVNGVNYDSVLVVNQKDEMNLIERYFEEEKYAARIGLIQKRVIALQTELNGTIRDGIDVRINLISHN